MKVLFITAKKIIIFFVIIFLNLSLNGCVYLPYSPKKLFKKAVANKPFDVIIVPGVPYENSLWGKAMKARIYWSKYLFDNGITKNIIYSGAAVYTPYTEGKIMQLYAVAIGIPEQNIFIETQAEHSLENIYYSYQLAQKSGFKNVAFATDPFQMALIKPYLKKIKLPITFIPVVFDTLRTMPMIEPEINLNEAYVHNFTHISKRKSLKERLAASKGKNIDIFK